MPEYVRPQAAANRKGHCLPIDSAAPATDATIEDSRGRSFLTSRGDLLLVIGVGGALGSLARWGVGELVPWSGRTFPWATFIENVSGALALGILMVFVIEVWPPRRYLRPFLGVGLLGGYTTFSTYMLEARHLLAQAQVATAFAYLGGSLLAGLAAVWIGIGIARLAVVGVRQRRLRHPERSSTRQCAEELRNP